MRRALALVLWVLACVLAPPLARAQNRDADALIAVAGAMETFIDGKLDKALEDLKKALESCSGDACKPATRAQIQVALGIVQGTGADDMTAAKTSFDAAFREDPNVKLDRQFATKEVERAFNEAKAAFKKGGGPPTPAAPPAPAGPGKAAQGAVLAARESLRQKDWSACMATAIAAMNAAEFAAGKLVLAECEDAGGLILEAMGDAAAARRLADKEKDADLQKRADELSERLRADVPKITVELSKLLSDPVVKIDGAVVKIDPAKPVLHNPGKAVIEVKARTASGPFAFKTTESVERGDSLSLPVGPENQQSSAVIQCILAAKTADDVNTCIRTGGKGQGLTLHAGLEVSTYVDDDHVDVLTPSVFVSAENPARGYHVGGSFLVDVVTQASVDIVATASRRLDEVRYAGTLAGDYKIGVAKVGASGAVSIEPDYVGRAVGGNVSADFFDKRVTPALAYHFGLDTIGRAKTPFSVFSHDVTSHTIDGSASIVVNESTIATLGGTAVFELGDTSKPYRHVPLFAPDVAARIPRGATPRLVNAVRLDAAPLEQLPDSRSRFALFARGARRLKSSTLRASERLYADSWGLYATTTDLRWLVDLPHELRAGPHGRFHLQGPVDFWQRAYAATPTSAGLAIPRYRAGDRELGPLFGVTGGGSVRWGFTHVLAATLEADVLYTQFLDHVYIFDRWSLFTATTIELTVD